MYGNQEIQLQNKWKDNYISNLEYQSSIILFYMQSLIMQFSTDVHPCFIVCCLTKKGEDHWLIIDPPIAYLIMHIWKKIKSYDFCCLSSEHHLIISYVVSKYCCSWCQEKSCNHVIMGFVTTIVVVSVLLVDYFFKWIN